MYGASVQTTTNITSMCIYVCVYGLLSNAFINTRKPFNYAGCVLSHMYESNTAKVTCMVSVQLIGSLSVTCHCVEDALSVGDRHGNPQRHNRAVALAIHAEC